MFVMYILAMLITLVVCFIFELIYIFFELLKHEKYILIEENTDFPFILMNTIHPLP